MTVVLPLTQQLRCRVLHDEVVPAAIAMAAVESECIFIFTFLSSTASTRAPVDRMVTRPSNIAISSASAVESVMNACLVVCQAIGVPP